MASNLIKNGHEVRVYDVNPEAVSKIAEEGAVPASSPSEAARDAAAVLTMLPSSPHVKEVATGKEGIVDRIGYKIVSKRFWIAQKLMDVLLLGVLKSLKPGSIIIDSSTIDPLASREVAEKAAEVAGG